ncbi:MAG: bifunctional D-glycero-beta-D-manno-heptose-7-phosphate kinase/D-glycero-beta-D-manno-heptose 1-phosphate adenylyltransferase HldE [Gammaproteobacteria bacterium]|nr:bifunctional D-glycero-beta-D-manno-heptose-7-phosphate kinase/D-glycero-beta-D-manno-heptose 1-phosphate adenylyltransferase HldE [Gammaproteobacteria bacterium]
MIDYFLPAEGRTVLVVGDVILDRYLYGRTDRISPEAPVPVVKVEKTEERLGGAANVAANIRALGLDVQLIGVTGDDSYADILSNKLSDIGVNYDFIRQESFPTVTKLRVLSQNQQLLRLDYEDDSDKVDLSLLSNIYKKHLDSAAIIVLSDYAKGSLKFTSDFIQQASRKNIITLVDPKGSDFSPYKGATLLTPNLKEFEAVVGDCSDEEDIVSNAKDLCAELELGSLLVTRGGDGMSYFDAKNNKILHLPARSHEVFDVTGAGDTVIATLAAALASSHTIEQAIYFANTAAALVIKKIGTASVTPEELNKSIDENNDTTTKGSVLSEAQLADTLARARARHEKIVMTNGCFDLLHAGHIDYLEKAKALGDRLLVAVNSDESVRDLKGDSRPINSVDNRMLVLAGLEATDWVCPFSENTPERLIELVKPDVLVKGSDYAVDQIAGADFVMARGGEVVTIEIENTSSTSSIVETILTMHGSNDE